MTSPVRTVKLSKTYEVRARKGLFKSEKRSVEALKSITLEVNQGEVFGAVDAFRSTMMGFPPGFPELASFPVELMITTLFGLIMPLLGYILYRRSENYARKHGSLSTY